MAVRIGELLLKEKRITPEQLQEALNYQRQNGGKLGFNLIKLGYVKDEEITALLSKQYGVPSIALGAVRDRSRRHQARSRRDRAEVPDRPALARRRHADDRDDRSDQRLRHGRHQVHDGLQRRAGRRVRDRGHRGHREVLRQGAAAAAAARAAAPSALEVASKALEDMPILGDTGDVEVLEELEEISAEMLAKQGEEAPVVKLVNVHPDVGDPEGRERHPHRAVREGAARPLPHRRPALQHHAAADEVPRRDHLAHQDHVEARHRREAPAAGRPHQDPLPGQRRSRRTSTSASPACRRSSARRSSCVCSTRTS